MGASSYFNALSMDPAMTHDVEANRGFSLQNITEIARIHINTYARYPPIINGCTPDWI